MEIPRPKDKTLLIDLDATLIDEKYQFNTPPLLISEHIRIAQELGWRVGLNSDTPLAGLQLWKERLQMNGPIVAEKGAIVELDCNVITDNELMNTFQEIHQSIVSLYESRNIPLWHGNATEMIRSGGELPHLQNKVVLINNLRMSSFGMFVREITPEGQLVINNALTEDLVNEALTQLPIAYDLLDIDMNHDYGVFILAHTKVRKRLGVEVLMERAGLQEIGMAGNSITDYVGSDLAKHYAVANSSDAFKEVADYISPQPVTQGVIE